jgi:hypothetical protein
MMRTTTNIALLTLAAWMALMLAGCSAYPVTDVKVSPAGTGPSAATSAAKAGDGLSPEDVKITLKVKSKQCFGDFGCNVTVSPEVTLLNEPGEGQIYEITFKAYGDENGPIVETVTMTGREVSSTELFLTTPRSSTKIYADVTEVEKWAY